MYKTTLLYLFVCMFMLSLLTGCGGDNSVTPPPSANQIRINSVTPSQLSRGSQRVTVEIHGSGFNSVVSVDLGIGIEIVSRNMVDPTRIDVIVNVGINVGAGPRTVVVSTAQASATLDSAIIIVENRAPTPDFFVNPNQGTPSTLFQFDAGGSIDSDGTIAGYRWELSDGTTGRGVKFQHQFSQQGTYDVTLTVTDNEGGVSIATGKIEVGTNKPPVASFIMTPASGTNLTIFSFDGTSSSDPDGSVDGYRWEFGDGATENGPVVTHKYRDAGEYRVELYVRDSEGAQSVFVKKLAVTLFDREQEILDISKVLVEFLNLFSELEVLSAEQIVQGFSKSPECTGREKELSVIRTAKEITKNSGVRIVGEPQVTSVNDKTANANISAEFHGTYLDGTSYSGVSTHYFTMKNEPDGWKICSFYLVE